MTAATTLERFRAQHDELAERDASSRPEWLTAVRRAALDRFLELGFPTTRDEDWRWTSVAPIAETEFVGGEAESSSGADLAGLRDEISFAGLEGPRLVFVNGRLQADLSEVADLPAGVEVSTLAERLAAGADLEPWLARTADHRDRAFTALNTAFVDDGACVRIAAGTSAPWPIQLVFLGTATGGPVVSHPRTLVVAEERSACKLVAVHAGTGRFFDNSVSEITLEPAARVEHVRVIAPGDDGASVGSVSVRQQRDSAFTSTTAIVGGSLVRSDLHVELAEQGAECSLNGVYLGRDREHVDCHVVIDHVAPRCVSRQLFKGLLAGRARGVFAGKVIVRQDAQQTVAEQRNQNLLLDEGALADTKPQLEIHADDVKCSHGATIGRLDEDAVFYLRSRGMDEAMARRLLGEAFAGEALGAASVEPVRERLEEAVRDWLAGTSGSASS